MTALQSHTLNLISFGILDLVSAHSWIAVKAQDDEYRLFVFLLENYGMVFSSATIPRPVLHYIIGMVK